MSQNNNPEIIYGKHPILDAFKAGISIDKVFIQEGTHGELEIEMRKACKSANVPMQFVPKERLNSITRQNHQGVIAFISTLPQYYSLKEIFPTILEREEMPLLLLLDGVTDVRNFGAIARSAEAMGVHAIVVPQKGAALVNAEAMKASAGALAHIPVCRETSLSVVLDFLALNDVQVVAADLRAGKPLHRVDFRQPTAILQGAEGAGVSKHLLMRVDDSFIIPMCGEVDSFNVSVATGITLYEAIRQRLLGE